MRLTEAVDLALTLMNDHGLGLTWSFGFDNAKQRCGLCQHHRRRITLSRHYVRLNDEAEVRDTILHEIAHALTGPGAGHGVQWQAQAIRIGARPNRCAVGVAMPEGDVEGVCSPGCTARHNRHRMPPKRLVNTYQCNRCLTPVTWVIVK